MIEKILKHKVKFLPLIIYEKLSYNQEFDPISSNSDDDESPGIMVKMLNSNYDKKGLMMNYYFAFKPSWSDKEIFDEYKRNITKKEYMYKYKIYLRQLNRAKNFHDLDIHMGLYFKGDTTNAPLFWMFGGILQNIIKEERKKKVSQDSAVCTRFLWYNPWPTGFIYRTYRIPCSALEFYLKKL